MANSDNIIQLNKQKPGTTEFEVVISGLEECGKPTVRFILEDAYDGVDWILNCVNISGKKWCVTFPTLEHLEYSSVNFKVEVIVDEYIFVPTSGTIEFIQKPTVNISESKQKPTVKTSFTSISEATSGGGDVVDHTAPTTNLLQPEFDASDKEDNTEETSSGVDIDDIADEVIPGQGIPYSERSTEKFDAKKVAEQILQQRFSITDREKRSVTGKGTLFQKDSTGSYIIPGLESPEQRQLKLVREQKVKEILGKK